MRKSMIYVSLIAALGLPSTAVIAAEPAATAASTPEHTFTANFGLFSEYRFRGIAQTFKKPAIQGGVDYAHSSGIYLGACRTSNER